MQTKSRETILYKFSPISFIVLVILANMEKIIKFDKSQLHIRHRHYHYDDQHQFSPNCCSRFCFHLFHCCQPKLCQNWIKYFPCCKQKKKTKLWTLCVVNNKTPQNSKVGVSDHFFSFFGKGEKDTHARKKQLSKTIFNTVKLYKWHIYFSRGWLSPL